MLPCFSFTPFSRSIALFAAYEPPEIVCVPFFLHFGFAHSSFGNTFFEPPKLNFTSNSSPVSHSSPFFSFSFRSFFSSYLIFCACSFDHARKVFFGDFSFFSFHSLCRWCISPVSLKPSPNGSK